MTRKRKICVMVVLLLVVTGILLGVFLPRSAAQLGLSGKMEEEIISVVVCANPSDPEMRNLKLTDTECVKALLAEMKGWSYAHAVIIFPATTTQCDITVTTKSGELTISPFEKDNIIFLNNKAYSIGTKEDSKFGALFYAVIDKVLQENDNV